MDRETRDTIIRLILDGSGIEAAVFSALLKKSKGEGDDLSHFIVPAGRMANLPDPACVARRLRGVSPVTRDDIERALDECSR